MASEYFRLEVVTPTLIISGLYPNNSPATLEIRMLNAQVWPNQESRINEYTLIGTSLLATIGTFSGSCHCDWHLASVKEFEKSLSLLRDNQLGIARTADEAGAMSIAIYRLEDSAFLSAHIADPQIYFEHRASSICQHYSANISQLSFAFKVTLEELAELSNGLSRNILTFGQSINNT